MGNLHDLEMRVTSMEETLARIENDVIDVVSIVRAGEGFFKVLGVIGRIVKWFLAIGASATAIYYAIKGVK